MTIVDPPTEPTDILTALAAALDDLSPQVRRAALYVLENPGEIAVTSMRGIADAHGASIPQVAIAWVLAQPSVTSVIIGAKKMTQLEDNLGAVDVELTEEDLAALDAASALSLEYPAWMAALPSDRDPGQERTEERIREALEEPDV